MSTYAVIWSEPRCDLEAGKLELGPESMRFEGSRVHWVAYADIEGVRIGHRARERLCGKPALVLDLGQGDPLRVGSVDGVGTIAELADQLTRLRRQR